MYTYIVVDDEGLIRKGLINQISTITSEQYSCIGEASNGADGLKLIQDKCPDIVITDMRMGRMSGEELLEQIRQNWPDLPVIVISGYRDFDYVKKAIEAKAVGYLLKPFSTEEIEKQLSDSVVRIKDAYAVRKMKQAVDYTAIVRKTQTFREIISSRWNDEIKEKVEEKGISIERKYNLIIFWLDNRRFDIYMQQIITDVFGTESYSVQNMASTWEYVILSEADPNKQSKNKVLIKKLIDKIAARPDITKYFAAYSTIPQGLSEIYRKVQLGRKELGALSLGSNGKTWELGSVDLTNIYKNVFSSEKREGFFLSMKYAFQTTDQIMEDYFYELGQKTQVLGQIENECQIIVELVNNYARANGVQSNDIISSFLPRYVFSDNMQKMQEEIGGYIRLIFSSIHMIAVDEGDIVLKLKEFVQENYFRKLTVGSTATHFDLSTRDCSEYFRDKIGMSFNDYLNNVRLEKAKVFLQQTDLSVEHISNEIGYANPKYFFRVFKKYAGMTPVEYRDQIREEDSQ